MASHPLCIPRTRVHMSDMWLNRTTEKSRKLKKYINRGIDFQVYVKIQCSYSISSLLTWNLRSTLFLVNSHPPAKLTQRSAKKVSVGILFLFQTPSKSVGYSLATANTNSFFLNYFKLHFIFKISDILGYKNLSYSSNLFFLYTYSLSWTRRSPE